MLVQDQLADPKILVKIGKLNSAGMSIQGITETLRKEDNINASFFSVKKALKIYSIRGTEIISGDELLKSEIKSIIDDRKSQLIAINNLTWELIKQAKEQGRLNLLTAIPAIKELREQVKLADDLLKEMNEGIDYRKMGNVAITQIIIEQLPELERSGYIKIINPVGKTIDLEKLKMEEEKENGQIDAEN